LQFLTACSDGYVRRVAVKVRTLTQEELERTKGAVADGKGIVYVYRSLQFAGSAVPYVLAVNNRVVGENAPGTNGATLTQPRFYPSV
jgi:hypothetical protein